MNIVRLRNGKVRLVAGAGIGLLVLGFIYFAHDTRMNLVATRSQVQDCEHRHESLSAQLQVIIEHRSRLEKSVQQEKLSHKQTKDKLEAQYEELQELSEKSKLEAHAKYSALQQQYKTLQKQQEDLHKEFSKLQQTNAELQEEKTNMINKMTSEMDQLRITKDAKFSQLQTAITRLEREKDDLLSKLDRSSLINQLQNDLALCKSQIKVSSTNTLLNYSKPLSSLAKLDDQEGLPLNADPIVQKVNKENSLHIVEQVNLPAVISEPHVEKPVESVIAIQEDNKNRRQIPPPLSLGEKENANHYLQDNEVNNIDDVRQVEEPARQGKLDLDNKEIGRLPAHRQAMGAQEQIGDGKGLDILKNPIDIANGLDQQENDEDQDLDNIENEIEDKKNGNQFDGADFDQADQDDTNGNRNNNDIPVKQEGVIAAPR